MVSNTIAVLVLVVASFTCRVEGSRSILVDLENGHYACGDSTWSKETSNFSCNSLQKALNFVANITEMGNDSYVEIQIEKGRYELSEPVTIEQNIAIRAQTPGVQVAFDNNSKFHAIFIVNVSFAAIEGIVFEGSEGIITFENVTRVSVSNSNFSYFVNGVLDMFMCFQVSVSDCIFEHNGPVTIIKQDQYRGSAAGVSIGYDDNHYSDAGTPPELVPTGGGSVSITGCIFRSNEHRPLFYDNLDPNEFLSRFLFPGRGGALSMTVNSSFPFNANISDCLVEKNFAQSLGGGFYFAFSGYSEHLIVVNNSTFVRGYAKDVGGGALFAGFVEAGSRESFSVRLEVFNSNFSENRAIFGGAIFFNAGPDRTRSGELTNTIRMENCTFTRNTAIEYGAAMCVASLLFLQPTFNISPIIILDSDFDDNDAIGRGGVLSTAYVPIYLGGNVNFRRNIGRSLSVIGTRVEVDGNVLFYGNGGSGIDGGSVYLTSFAQLEVSAGARIDFINNTGVLGAALVVDYHTSSVSRTYLQTVYNPLCPIRCENSTWRPDDWNVNIYFDGNEAFVGSAVFLNGIHACAWTGQNTGYDLQPSRAFRWDFIEFGVNTNTVHGAEKESAKWYVQTPAEGINIRDNVTAFLGEEFNLNFVDGVDELGGFTAVVIQLSDASDTTDLSFIPGTGIPQKGHDISVNSRFLSRSGRHGILEKPRRTLMSSLLTTNVIQEYFYITPQVCPAGYKLTKSYDNSEYDCMCNSENDTRIASCRGRRILLTGKIWAASVTNVNETSHSLSTHPCPFHYCSCIVNGSACMYVFDEEESYKQCHCSRSGVLCGGCNNGLGFSVLLNKCVKCRAVNILWVAGLVLADALFIGLFLISKCAPLDLFYPVLYYIQIVPLMTFFFPHTFEIIQPYVLYVSSALSFYFAFDFCVFPGLIAEYSYLIRFLPLCITIVLCIVVAVHRSYYRLQRQPWYGLWWVILLQYTHLVYTAMSILSCPNLPDSNGVINSRWMVNGNSQCFKDLHLVISLVAMVVLALCISIIPVIFIYSQGRLEKPVILNEAFGELSSAFKPNYSWWPAMELFRRLMLVFFIVVFPGNDYPVIFYLAITVTVCTFTQPFKHAISNVLDALLTTDVLILLLIRNTSAISFGEDREFSLPDRNVKSSWNCSDLPTDQKLTHRVIALAPFYFIPLVVLILTTIALIFYYIWLRVEKYRHSNTDEDIETISHSYAHNNPTTTYLDVGDGLDPSLSGRFKKSRSRLHKTTRYLRSGWTRRPRVSVQRKHRLFQRRKGQSLLEDMNNYPSSLEDERKTKIMKNRPKAFKKKSPDSQNLGSFGIPTSHKITSGETKSLPRLVKPQAQTVSTKSSATLEPFRRFEDIELLQTTTHVDSNQDRCEDHSESSTVDCNGETEV